MFFAFLIIVWHFWPSISTTARAERNAGLVRVAVWIQGVHLRQDQGALHVRRLLSDKMTNTIFKKIFLNIFILQLCNEINGFYQESKKIYMINPF